MRYRTQTFGSCCLSFNEWKMTLSVMVIPTSCPCPHLRFFSRKFSTFWSCFLLYEWPLVIGYDLNFKTLRDRGSEASQAGVILVLSIDDTDGWTFYHHTKMGKEKTNYNNNNNSNFIMCYAENWRKSLCKKDNIWN